MERQAVKSSNVKSIGYDAESKELHVEFNNGGLYCYADFPQPAYDELSKVITSVDDPKNKQSIGSYLHKTIKSNYSCKKISQ